MYSFRKGWLKHLSADVFERLCSCQTIRMDIQELADAKWQAYKDDGRADQGLTKKDALVSVLELLDSNSCHFDLSMQEYDNLCAPNGPAGLQPQYAEQTQDCQNVICLTLASSQGEYRLGLPAADEELERAKQALGIEEFVQAGITAVGFSAQQLAPLLPLDAVAVEDANTLAECLQEMEGGELKKYYAALDVEHPDTFSEAVNIAMDIDDYEMVPEDMDEYGRQVLRRIGADDEIIDTIDGFMDFAGLGEMSMEEDGVRRTEFGLVRRLSNPFPEQPEMSQQML